MAQEEIAVLPSASAALEFWQGQPGAPLKIGRDVIVRAILIRLGMQGARLLGQQLPNNAFFLSLLGSAAIEAFVLAYVKAKMPNATPQPEIKIT